MAINKTRFNEFQCGCHVGKSCRRDGTVWLLYVRYCETTDRRWNMDAPKKVKGVLTAFGGSPLTTHRLTSSPLPQIRPIIIRTAISSTTFYRFYPWDFLYWIIMNCYHLYQKCLSLSRHAQATLNHIYDRISHRSTSIITHHNIISLS